jgi:hypothetical protein
MHPVILLGLSAIALPATLLLPAPLIAQDDSNGDAGHLGNGRRRNLHLTPLTDNPRTEQGEGQ